MSLVLIHVVVNVRSHVMKFIMFKILLTVNLKFFLLIKLFSHFESTVTFVLMKVNTMLSDFQC